MKILLAVDGSPYTQRMLDYLASSDECFGQRHSYVAMTALTELSARVRGYFDKETIDQHYREQADAVLEPVRAFAASHGWKLETMASPGRPSDVIAQVAAQGNFDLVVLGSQGHSSVGALFLGSVSMEVLVLCKVPALIIR